MQCNLFNLYDLLQIYVLTHHKKGVIKKKSCLNITHALLFYMKISKPFGMTQPCQLNLIISSVACHIPFLKIISTSTSFTSLNTIFSSTKVFFIFSPWFWTFPSICWLFFLGYSFTWKWYWCYDHTDKWSCVIVDITSPRIHPSYLDNSFMFLPLFLCKFCIFLKLLPLMVIHLNHL